MQPIKNLIFVFLLLLGSFAQAQDTTSFIEHLIQKNETIAEIAKKYQVTPFDIYQLNPDASGQLQENKKLLIPINEKNKKFLNQLNTHQVAAGETWFGIAKQYQISVENLQNANLTLLADGLKIGSTLMIPAKVIVVNNKQTASSNLIHTVKPSETKYSISKQYGVSIEDIDQLNPEVKEVLPLGYELKIPSKKPISTKPTEVMPSALPVNLPVASDHQHKNTVVVEKGQTLFSLTRALQISEDDLIKLNPELKDGLKEGMVLQLGTAENKKTIKTELNLEVVNTTPQKIGLLMPFNFEANQHVDPKAKSNKFANDSFFNMTMDVYSGMRMAMDTIKKHYPHITIDIFDSAETTQSSEVLALHQNNQLHQYPLLIGPFYPKHLEELLKVNTTSLIVSPLRTLESSYPNLVQSLVHEDDLKLGLITHFKNQNHQTLALVDAKKTKNITFLKNHLVESHLLTVSEDFAVATQNLRGLLQKNKTNALIINTEGTSFMLKALQMVKTLKAEGFKIQLTMLEFDEVMMQDDVFPQLLKHQVIFPSVYKNIDHEDLSNFEKSFKNQFKMYPTPFAIRGYDLLIDMAKRLTHSSTFQDIFNPSTTQVDSKFNYEFNPSSGFKNKGMFLLQYLENYGVKVHED